jgi:ubiquinone/menaquinone biosynthesis C-methylase UbiE
VRTDYNAGFARRYSRARSLSAELQEIWVRALSLEIRGREVQRVLDLGAGIGRFWPVLQAALGPSEIVAVDRSAAMLSAAPDDARVGRIVADIDRLPLAPGVFDACFCSMVVHYSADPPALLERISLLLRPSGHLLVRTATVQSLETCNFLRCFPTARAVEARIMPTDAELLGWFDRAVWDEVRTTVVAAPAPRSRRALLARVAARGFPSLQLVPRREFALGVARFATSLALGWLRREAIPQEETVLVSARKGRS